MKKGLFLLLLTFLFTVGPSVIQAHAMEITKPEDILDLVTNKLSSATANVSDRFKTSTGTINHSQMIETEKTESGPMLLSEMQPQNESRDTLKTDNPKPDIVQQPGSGLNEDTNLGAAGKVDLNLLAKGPTGDNKTSKAELLGLGINNSALLGKVNVSILSNEQSMNGSNTGSLATVTLNNAAEKTHVEILQKSKEIIGDTINTHSGLVITDLKNTILGDARLGVGEVSSSETPTYKYMNAGLITVNIDNLLLGSNHIGVAEVHLMDTDKSTTTAGGLVIIDLQTSPLGDTHLGVGEFSDTKVKPNPSVPILNNNPEPVIPIGLSYSNIYGDDKNEQQQLNRNTQQFSAKDDDQITLNELIKYSGNTADQTILNRVRDSSLFGKMAIPTSTSANPSNSDIQIAFSSASSASGSSNSGSESVGSTFSGGGSGAAGLFDSVFPKESELKNHFQFILHELSDEWIKAPPSNPPQETFFLSMKNLK